MDRDVGEVEQIQRLPFSWEPEIQNSFSVELAADPISTDVLVDMIIKTAILLRKKTWYARTYEKVYLAWQREQEQQQQAFGIKTEQESPNLRLEEKRMEWY